MPLYSRVNRTAGNFLHEEESVAVPPQAARNVSVREAIVTRETLVSLGLVALTCGGLCPAAAFAQSGSSIFGTVKDTTGAVLPGVTVEASSPALIEKVRSIVTDAEGVYRIIELRPGTYTITVKASSCRLRLRRP